MIKVVIGIAGIFAISCTTATNSNRVAVDQTANVNSKFSTTNTITVTAPAIPESQISNSNIPSGARTFVDGSQIVGKDIQPGLYRTRTGTPNCIWTRRSGITGEASEVVASERPQGPAIVMIKSSDKAFESSGCGMWTSDLSRVTTDTSTPFGDGEYQVGVDIAPGTWKAQNTPGCYWSRLKGFSGEPEDVITNSNDSGIVEIRATDKGFVSSGCGSWTRVD